MKHITDLYLRRKIISYSIVVSSANCFGALPITKNIHLYQTNLYVKFYTAYHQISVE